MRIKSFLFFIALLIGAQAFATTYIKEVKVIGHKDETAFKNLETALKKAGWQALNKDLNSGCGKKSDYIHLLYKTETSNSGTNYGYITGFYISNTYSTSVTYGGRTYYPVPCQGSDDFVASNGDLNNNAGGKYIYLYYTTDYFSDNRAVTGIYFNTTQSGGVPLTNGTSGYDLNKDAGGDYIYMHLNTATAPRPLSGSGSSGSPYLIASKADWDKFTQMATDDQCLGKCFKLTANISNITTMAGTKAQPFTGTFDGNGKTLTVNISSAASGAAPFQYVNGATIKNLTVGGSVVSTSGAHAAGLVGLCNGTNAITGCTVNTNVNGYQYAGGIVGHGGTSTLNISNCSYSGNISSFNNYAGGLLGWCDAMTLNMSDCWFRGSFSPASGGLFHPIACKTGSASVTASSQRVYYTSSAMPTATGNHIISGAQGLPVLPGKGTAASPYLISTNSDWQAFTMMLQDNQLSNKQFKLAGNISISTMAGTDAQPFRGTFDGNGKTLTVNISSSEIYAAPFRYINGAIINNLTVGGSVSSSARHAAGLVGLCSGTDTITACVVNANVNSYQYAGGIVGHGGTSTLTITDSYYAGTISGFNWYAGGLVGCCGAMTLSMSDCLFRGSFSPEVGGLFHPIACKISSASVTATTENVYYLNTIEPPTTGDYIIPGAKGVEASTTYVTEEFTYPLKLIDGNIYYIAHGDISVRPGPGYQTTTYVPFYLRAPFDMTQQIFTHRELDEVVGSIKSISFRRSQKIPFAIEGIEVYLKHTDKESFNDKWDMIPCDESDKVFEGTFSADDSKEEWVTVTLDTPFEYNGTSNLMVCFYKPTYSAHASEELNQYFYKRNTSSQRCLQHIPYEQPLGGSDYYDPFNDDWAVHDDILYTGLPSVTTANHESYAFTLNYVSDIRFSVSLNNNFPRPTNPAANVLNDENVTCSWTAPETSLTVTGYAYQYKKNSDADWSAEVTVDSNTTSVTLSGLYGSTGYQFRVKTLYGSYESLYKYTTFTTAKSLPTLAVSKIYNRTAKVSWDAPTTSATIIGYAYQYKKNSDADWSAEVTLGINTTSVTLSGLSPSTKYQCRVKIRYNDYESAYTVAGFTTEADPVDLPYEYGFENGWNGWNRVNCYLHPLTPNDPYNKAYTGIKTHEGFSYEGNYFFMFDGNIDIYKWTQYLVSPHVPETTILILSFYYMNERLEWTETFQVGYSKDSPDISNFEWGEEIHANNALWTKYETTLPIGTRYVAIKYPESNSSYLYLDNFSFEEYSGYAKPTDLAVSSLTDQSVTLGWVRPNDATSTGYAYQYKKKSDADWSEENTLTTHSVTIDNLVANTNYEFRIKALYPGDNSSNYVSTEFMTEGEVEILPHYQGFENGMGGWRTVDASIFTGIERDASTAHQGSYYFYYDNIPNSYLISPQLDGGDKPVRITFHAKNIVIENMSILGSFQLGVSYASKNPSDFQWSAKLGTSSSWIEYCAELPACPKYIAIKVVGGAVIYFDEISILEILDLTPDGNNASIVEANQGETFTVRLTGRTLYKDGAWNTLCLPFDIPLDESPLIGADARYLEDARLNGNGRLELDFSSPVDHICAGTPYIIRWAKAADYDEADPETRDLKDPLFHSVTISGAINDYESWSGKVKFRGNYDPITFTENNKNILFMGENNTLYYPGEGAHIYSHRAYFELNYEEWWTQVKGFKFNFGDEDDDDDDPTGILPLSISPEGESTEASPRGGLEGVLYTLDGRKVVKPSNGKLPKGIYINNGKKIYIK